MRFVGETMAGCLFAKQHLSPKAWYAGGSLLNSLEHSRPGSFVRTYSVGYVTSLGPGMLQSPNIDFEDADVEVAANGAVSGLFAATGQRCMAGSRFFVQEGLHDKLVERLAEKANLIKLGDPLDEETEMEPIAFKKQLDKVQGYVETGGEEGAELVAGGKRPEKADLWHGFFIEPTILTGVDHTMTVAREEIFGPVSSIISIESEEEVVRQANDTPYGLAPAV